MPVVDASVVVDWVAPDAEPGGTALTLLDQLATEETKLIAPRIVLEEVSNALLTGVRRRRWTGTAADSSQAVLMQLPVQLIDDRRDLDRAWDLARRYDNWPIYDLLYVALAERRRTYLVTSDVRLRRKLSALDWVVAPEDLLA